MFDFSNAENEKIVELLRLSSEMNRIIDECVKFSESAEVGMLRASLTTLAAKMQAKGVFGPNLHINNGVVVRHLGPEDDDPTNTRFDWVKRET